MTATTSLPGRTRAARLLASDPRSFAWGASTAVLAAVAGLWILPPATVTLLGVIGFGVGFLGYIDLRTKLILNRHTAGLALAVTAMLVTLQVTRWPEPVLLVAVISAAVMFAAMVALIFLTGFGSGGDIKLVPVVAAGLSVISPVAPAVWLLVALMLCLGAAVIRIARTGSSPTLAMAPFMAAAVPLSVLGTAAVHAAAGMALPGI